MRYIPANNWFSLAAATRQKCSVWHQSIVVIVQIRYRVYMRTRVFILILLLIGQPISAASSVWQTDLSAQSGSVGASHCEGAQPAAAHASGSDQAAQHHHPESGAAGDPKSMSEHEDCTASCNMCASCAASIAADAIASRLPMARPQIIALWNMPSPGTPELLYRPPITF
jgi:hypothetical protein